jgi:tRNA(Ile)-lysidine synthase TilS/MesJ
MSESGLQRGVTARDEYEKLTREARYDLYKAVIGGQSEHAPGIICNGVCVGHHEGDLQENVISNMMKGGSLLDLAGMGTTSGEQPACAQTDCKKASRLSQLAVY